jgi:lactoylglutathione lyase
MEMQLVMLWRRVDDLPAARAETGDMIHLPVIGDDAYSTMYDAGGVMLGVWQQDRLIGDAQAALTSVGRGCSDLNLTLFESVSNPASALMLVPRRMDDAVGDMQRALHTRVRPVEGVAGRTFSFFDVGGNLSTLLEPSDALMRGRVGGRLRELIDEFQPRIDMPAVSHRLLVSDVERSRQFYGDVLGLTQLNHGDRGASFDAGKIVLSLELEQVSGQVRRLSKSKQLQGDWLTFYVSSIEDTFGRLSDRGVAFPVGIEKSGIGQTAYFNDPDGYSLNIWQPPDRQTQLEIDFFPTLDRLLV